MKPKITYSAPSIPPNNINVQNTLGEPWAAELDGAWFAPDLEIVARYEETHKRLSRTLLDAQVARTPVTIEVEYRTYSFVPERVEVVHGYEQSIRVWFTDGETNRLP